MSLVLPSCLTAPSICTRCVAHALSVSDMAKERRSTMGEESAHLKGQTQVRRVYDGVLRDKRAGTGPRGMSQARCSGGSRRGRLGTYLMGVKVSKPLAIVHGRRLALSSSCTLRAVMSTASAARPWPSISAFLDKTDRVEEAS